MENLGEGISTMENFIAPIVGQNFRPPAQIVLQTLPFETPLLLRRQPENEYDPNAIQVLLPGFAEGEAHSKLFSQCFETALPDQLTAGKGLWNKCDLNNPLHLGYIKAKNGPAAEIASLMDSLGKTELSARLSATATGQPAAVFQL